MEVPCPVPLSQPRFQPWSPLGYRIVELPQAAGPPGDGLPGVAVGDGAPRQVTLADSAARTPSPPQPRAPVGYRVVMVADEQLPVERRPEKPAERFRARPSIALPNRKPGSTPAAVWIPLAAVGVVVVMPALALALMIATRTPAPPRAQLAQAVLPQNIVVPQALREKPAVAPKPDEQEQDLDLVAKLPPGILPNDVCEDCEQDDGKVAAARRQVHDRQGFATAVAFARNPQEADRIAKAEDKLTFILHLSGNFEDPGFT